jgi:hypothetical protein
MKGKLMDLKHARPRINVRVSSQLTTGTDCMHVTKKHAIARSPGSTGKITAVTETKRQGTIIWVDHNGTADAAYRPGDLTPVF